MTRADNPQDPVLAAEVERAIAPYRSVLPAEAIRVIAEILEHALTTHPVGAELLDRVRPRADRLHSGNETKGAADPAPAASPTRKAGAK